MRQQDFLKFDLKISPESRLFSAHPSIGSKQLQKFKRGQFTIDATLDLHGYTLEQAEDVLKEFLENCLAQQFRYLLIIHGKGSKAILKNHVNRYLDDHSQVLAFCSAKPKDGGLGAVYVLLKKQKHTEEDDNEE